MKKIISGLLLLAVGMGISMAQPVITNQPANETVLNGGTAIFSVGVSGTAPFTYQWQFNGTNLPNRNDLIYDVAGVEDETGYGGDGGPATNAVLFSPSAVAIDAAGRIFIADQSDNRIRMVNTNGIINTVAGIGPNGSSGSYAGDDGPATNANLNQPSGIAVDGSGNFYIADTGNGRIRKVDTNGIITTVAGTNGTNLPLGDGGLAIDAQLKSPSGLTLDAQGDLFIVDSGNNRIREVDTNGIIATVAGTNSPGFSGDMGPAIAAKLSLPSDVAVDEYGNLFIADNGNNRIRKVDTNGIITTIAGTNIAGFFGDGGAATNARLNSPYGVTVDADNDVYIADRSNNRIRMINTAGIISTVVGNGIPGTFGDGGAPTNASIAQAGRLRVDSNGNLFFPQSNYSSVREVNFGHVPTLQLNGVGATNVGNYDVIVTSSDGSVTSSVVSLTVFLPPAIVTQPTDIVASIGSSNALSVVASNFPPLNYQWFTVSGRTATATAIILDGMVVQIIVTDGGSGYTSPPNVHLIGGGGTGVTAATTLIDGAVASIPIYSTGYSYTTPPSVVIDPPPTTNNAVADGTNASLEFPSLSGADSTNYFVVVTNDYGSVTSTIVAVRALLPPQNFTAQRVETGVQLTFTGTPNYLYGIQSTTNLTPPVNWTTLSLSGSDTNGNWTFTETNLENGQQFYRAMTPSGTPTQ